jgi:hypothetical protein
MVAEEDCVPRLPCKRRILMPSLASSLAFRRCGSRIFLSAGPFVRRLLFDAASILYALVEIGPLASACRRRCRLPDFPPSGEERPSASASRISSQALLSGQRVLHPRSVRHRYRATWRLDTVGPARRSWQSPQLTVLMDRLGSTCGDHSIAVVSKRDGQPAPLPCRARLAGGSPSTSKYQRVLRQAPCPPPRRHAMSGCRP